MPPETVRIFHTPGCGRCRAAGEFFTQRGFDIQWRDVAGSMNAKREMLRLAPGNRQVPVIQWGDVVKVGWEPELWNKLLEGS